MPDIQVDEKYLDKFAVTRMEPPDPAKIYNQLIVRVELIHQPFGEQPKNHLIQFGAKLDTKEDLFQRRIEVKPIWEKLDISFLKSPGLMVIENRAGAKQHQMTKLTEAEEKAIKDQIVLVATSPDDPNPWKIRPLHPFIGEPSCPLWLKSLSGMVTINLTVFPQ